MDISTCEPVENIMVEIWHCNSTGSYSYFTTSSLDTPSGGGGGGGGMGNGSAPSGVAPSGSGTAPTALPSSTNSSTISRRAQDDDSNDDGTFLRGGYPTNSNGLVEFEVSLNSASDSEQILTCSSPHRLLGQDTTLAEPFTFTLLFERITRFPMMGEFPFFSPVLLSSSPRDKRLMDYLDNLIQHYRLSIRNCRSRRSNLFQRDSKLPCTRNRRLSKHRSATYCQ